MKIVLLILILLACVSTVAANDHGRYPWSIEHQCEFDVYSPIGIFPTMRRTLQDLELEHRITRGFDPKKINWNYHQADYTFEGISYSAAVDISTRCLSDAEIGELLSCLLYTSPSPRDLSTSRMPSSA